MEAEAPSTSGRDALTTDNQTQTSLGARLRPRANPPQKAVENHLSFSSPQVRALLAESVPCRSKQVDEILSLVGTSGDAVPPLLVHGGPATGKTLVVKEVFRLLGRTFAYINCRSCHTPRLMFESVVNQLHGHKREARIGYGGLKRCDRLAELVHLLPAACRAAIEKRKGRKRKGRGEEVNESVILVFDNVELLRNEHSSMLAALLRLPELSGLSYLGVVMISSLSWDGLESGTGSRTPLQIYFPDYNNQELERILERRHPNELYSAFLSSVLPTFSRACRRLTELGEAMEPLYKKYCEPVDTGRVQNNENGRRRLYTMIAPHIKHAMADAVSIGDGMASSSSQLDFELSLCSKYLLLAAYIATRNPPTLDATLFEASGAEKGPRKRRRSSVGSQEKREAEVHELQMKGAIAFPVERLFAIYQSIASESEDLEISQAPKLSAAVMAQVATLTSTNLLTRLGGDPLEGGARYRCNIAEDVVQKILRSPLWASLLHLWSLQEGC